MDSEQPGNLEQQILELRGRVAKLEQALQGRGLLQDQSRVDDLPPDMGISAPPVSLNVAQSLPAGLPISRSAGDKRSLESRIGSQWFNRIGILAVLIGMSWFLKLAIDNHWIGPLGRVLIGLLSGAAIIAWSERFHRRGYAGFGYSLKAIGSGILYLSLWAAFSLFHLIPGSVAFGAMILVTAFNGFMAWIQDAELLALYSIVGGLSTPLLLSTGENHEVSLFSYLLLLDLAVLVLVILRPWSRLLFGAFVGTTIFFIGWWFQYYSSAQFGRTAFFLGCFFLLFAFTPRLVRLRAEEAARPSAWDRLALEVLPVANAAFGFLGFYSMLTETKADWATPWLAVGFAAFYLLLFRLPAPGTMRETPPLLSMLHLTAAVVFLTIAIPLKAHGRWLTIGWLVQGAALLWIASRAHSVLLRALSLFCMGLGLFALIAINPAASITPIFNERFGTYCVAIAVFAFAGWLAASAARATTTLELFPWRNIAGGSILIVNSLILVAMGWEIHSYWWSVRWRGDWNLMHDYRMYAQFTYSALFMTFGAMLLGIGFARRSAFVRWQALVLVAASIAKVFLMDTSALSQGYRILSFLGLGGLLLAVSFVYQRDWLHLRNPERQDS